MPVKTYSKEAVELVSLGPSPFPIPQKESQTGGRISLGKIQSNQTQLEFSSQPTGIIVFSSAVNKVAELFLGLQFFLACTYGKLCQTYIFL